MPASPRILLVSPDLMVTSRVAALAREAGGSVETLRSPDQSPSSATYDLVLLDLQAVPGDAAVIVSQTHAIISRFDRESSDAPVRLVAFGPHVAKQRLDDAKAAGADAVVSRGELLGSFPAIIRRWCPPA
ncbi:MAG: hypothetical protein RLZZ21_2303 [Planctomycetota bacterium]|jgi:hypothetical protein